MTSSAQVRKVLDGLRAEYGISTPGRRRSALDTLIVTILSQNTSDANSGRAFAALKEAFPTWEKALAADRGRMARAIRTGGLADRKAATIHRVLLQTRERFGSLSLARLAGMDTDPAMDFLLSMKGVGRKTAACVLLFSLGRPVFPVDTHIYRVTGRLGWLPERATPSTAHDSLSRLLPANRYYEAHINLITHGRRLCSARRPECERCCVRKWCGYYRSLRKSG